MYPKITRGSKIGIHAIQSPNTAIPRLRQMVEQGITCPVFKSVDNVGTILDGIKISPNTIFIYRFVNPDDGAQDIDRPDFDYTGAVTRTFQKLHDRIRSPEERALLFQPNFYVEILNEADPPNIVGWQNFGKLCRMMAEEGTRQGIKVALPAFNSGTPEYDELIVFSQSGVFQEMVKGGHLWTIHEGPTGVKDPVITYGTIPNAPVVERAGVLTLRYRFWLQYLKSKSIPIPAIVITEFYAGGGHLKEVDAETTEQIVERFRQADAEYRKDPEIIGVLPFTLGVDATWEWSHYDFAYDGIINHMASIKNYTNEIIPPSPVLDNVYTTTSALNVREYPWFPEQKKPPVVRVIPANMIVTVYWTLNPTGKSESACISPSRNEWVSMAYLRKLVRHE